jgi:hypothetical protein
MPVGIVIETYPEKDTKTSKYCLPGRYRLRDTHSGTGTQKGQNTDHPDALRKG